jgi:nicotinate phosphoribosyltransferase
MTRQIAKDFGIPAIEIRDGFYSDKYLVRSRTILEKDGLHPNVVMQVFCKKDALLCGVEETVACLKRGSVHPKRFKIYALRDGDKIRPWESVMHIVGDYTAFAHLETLYLGILARRTSVATAVRTVAKAAKGRPILFFSARFDHYGNQAGDGSAAAVGGVAGLSTDANVSWLQGRESFGTIPHGLIAAYGGDTLKASVAFDRTMPKKIKRIVLVDFKNDCAGTSVEVARALKKRLWGVRLDTAREIRDFSVKGRGPGSYGVCPELVWNVRRALDRAGFPWVKIIVSGGFNAERIREFVRKRVPFDAVGVGSHFYHERIDFTADIVKVNGKPCAKVGRRYRPNSRLKRIA